MSTGTIPGASPFGGPPYKDEALAVAELRRYVYDYDPRASRIPKRIDPAQVERFLLEAAAAERPAPGPAAHMVDVADRYDAKVAAAWMALLDRKESSEEAYRTSMELTRGLGILGNAQERGFGRRYYRHLLGLPYTEKRAEELLFCLAEYVLEESGAATADRLGALISSLAARAATDAAVRPVLHNMEDLKAGIVPRVERAGAYRAEIGALGDPAQRLDRLVAIYLGVDLAYNEYLKQWVVRALLQEARAGRAAEEAAAFRRAAPKAFPGEDEGMKLRRARAMHAVEFLGSPVSAEERAAFRPDTKRDDPLSTEGY